MNVIYIYNFNSHVPKDKTSTSKCNENSIFYNGEGDITRTEFLINMNLKELILDFKAISGMSYTIT